MKDYTSLVYIRDMDFKQMRAQPCKAGMCATDAAIKSFGEHFVMFFAQFNKCRPNKEELDTYNELMQEIIQNASKAEHEYFLKKDENIPPEQAKAIADSNIIRDIKGLTTRMQYWAASAGFGNSIRNIKVHKVILHEINRWSKYSKDSGNPRVFFNKLNFDEDKKTVEYPEDEKPYKI